MKTYVYEDCFGEHDTLNPVIHFIKSDKEMGELHSFFFNKALEFILLNWDNEKNFKKNKKHYENYDFNPFNFESAEFCFSLTKCYDMTIKLEPLEEYLARTEIVI